MSLVPSHFITLGTGFPLPFDLRSRPAFYACLEQAGPARYMRELVPGLELGAWDAALADNRQQCADAKLLVVGNRHRNRGPAFPFLHGYMTAATAHLDKPMPPKNPANITA